MKIDRQDMWAPEKYKRLAAQERHDENLNRVCPACEGYGLIGNGLSHQNDVSCWLCGEYGWTTNARWYGFQLEEVAATRDEEAAGIEEMLADRDDPWPVEIIDAVRQRCRVLTDRLTKLREEAGFMNVSPDDFIEERNRRYARD